MTVQSFAREAGRALTPGEPGPVSSSEARLLVELYSDFGCPFCRQSAPAVLAARSHFGDEVAWGYRFLAKPPTVGKASFRSALAGVCIANTGGFWDYYERLTTDIEWSEPAVSTFLRSIQEDDPGLSRCMDSPDTRSRVWRDVFVAAAVGLRATPTLRVNGVSVEGLLTPTALIDLIESQLAMLPTSPGG